ncbi:hypothetical protein [Consotaella salsifontis]|nr:hypothetical protein [Consotaella salsifontis]
MRHWPCQAAWRAVVLVTALAAASQAEALSQIGSDNADTAKEGIIAVPLPPLDAGQAAPASKEDGAKQPAPASQQQDQQQPDQQPKAETPGAGDAVPPTDAAATAAEEPAEVFYGDADLPTPVRDLRLKLMEIARTGDIEKLRPYIETGDDGTVLTFGDMDTDPISFLKQASGDGEGTEILAILLETLEAGHVHNDPGQDDEIYVWPYFTQMALEKLTKPQMVELFKLVTAGDFEEMKSFGAYNFYRVGISPDGKLQFFVAGD